MILICAFIIGASVWLYSMDLAFGKKYRKVTYLSYVLFDILMEILNEFTSLGCVIDGTVFTVLTFTYTTIFICLMYKGRTHRKILHVGVLFLMSLMSDFIVLICFLGFRINMQQMSEHGIFNSLATLASKILLYIVIKIAFRKIKMDSIFEPLVFLIIVLELPSITLFRMETNFLIVYVLSQAVAATIIIYIIKLLNRKKIESQEMEDKAAKYRTKAGELEKEANELRIKAEKLEKKALELEKKLSIGKQNKNLIELYENRKKIFIGVEDVIYAERVGRKIVIETRNGRHEVNTSIQKLSEQLGEKFIRINQGTLINKKYIKKLEGETLHLNEVEFHISREKERLIRKELRKDVIQ